MSAVAKTRGKAAAPTRISLVLGAGGARGYAHIGAIAELEAQGWEIAAVSGSSMGALVGGIHAAGKLAAFRDFACSLARLDVIRLLDWNWSGGGLIKGDRIIEVLRELIGETDIEALPIPYTAVAVDLEGQKEVWLSRGSLFEAIRASIAIPTLLRPQRRQGRLLVDGGLLNPLPVAPTLRDLTDLIVAVDVNALPDAAAAYAAPKAAAKPPETPAARPRNGQMQRIAELIEGLVEKREAKDAAHEPGAFELLGRSFELVQAALTRLQLAVQPPDLLISIPRSACAFHEFHRAEELIELGRERTRRALAQWRASVIASPGA